MRKNVIIPAFAAALALVSCVKTNELPAPVETRTVSFHAVSPDTKAVFTAPEGNQYPVLWTANDTKVNVIQNYKTVGTVDITRSADNKTATFEAELTTGAAENYLVAVSPASAVASISNSEERINFEVPSGQECSSASPDEKAMILVAKKDLGAELPKTESLTFNHFTGYLHLMFSNYASALSDANVQSVSITSAKDISGRVYYYPKNDDIVPNAMSKTVSVTPENLDNVWVGLAPVDLSSEKISITVSTDKGTLTKELTFPANRNLTSGKIANIPVDMSGISLVAPVKYKLVKGVDELHVGDKIIIAAANYDRAVSATQKTNNRDAADIVKDGEYIIDPSDAVEIIELEEGLKPGEYAFKATLKPGYLSALSGGNLLKTESTINEYGSFAISIEPTAKDPETEASVSYAATVYAKASDHYFRYNNLWNSSTSSYNNLFSAYSSSSKTKFINLYRLEEPADASLRFKVTMPDADDAGAVTVPAAGKELEVYVFGNTPWTASVTGGATLSSTSGNGNSIIKLTVPENTGSSTLDYTVTVKTTASVANDTYTFNLSQVSNTIVLGAVLFEDDFEWLQPYVTGWLEANTQYKADDLDPVKMNASSHQQPNIWNTPALATTVGAKFEELGYEDLNKTGKTLYMQHNYFKMGAKDKQTGIKLPAVAAFGTTPIDVMLTFDWCAHMTTSDPGVIDNTPIVVVVEGAGKCSDSNAATSNAIITEQAAGKLEWQHASVRLNGVTSATRISIKPNRDNFTWSGQHRWHLDNIKIQKIN